MPDSLFKKGLVVSIIALFICMGIQPALSNRINNESNNPPYVPSNFYPDGIPVDIDVILSWDGGDPDPEDTVTYDIYFGSYNPPPYEATIGPYPANQTRIEYDPEGLIYVKNYYWHVVAIDNHGLQTSGPIWSFTTIYPNHPPDKPSIKGKVMIHEPGPYDYKFKATDPDGDDVRYLINWNDGSFEWTDYYPSGVEVIVNHYWSNSNTVTLIARANDTHGALGPWGTIQWSKADKEEDCFECQSNGKTHLAEKIFNRLEKNEVISKSIASFNRLDGVLKFDYSPLEFHPIYCSMLIFQYALIGAQVVSLSLIVMKWEEHNPILYDMFGGIIIDIVIKLGYKGDRVLELINENCFPDY